MTDNEIIKAFKLCVTNDYFEHNCKECSFKQFGDVCMDVLCRQVLDLINRQKAEIERLTVNMNAFGLGMKRESERADTARAEAIKEFAERLKENVFLADVSFGYGKECWEDAVAVIEIDNLVKEMVGDDNG